MSGKLGMKAYSLEIKQEAVQLFFEQGWTKREILVKLGIKNDTQLEGWLRAFRKSGVAGLQAGRIGRPRKVAVNLSASDTERIRQLEMENEILRNFLSETARGW
jgi:transposase